MKAEVLCDAVRITDSPRVLAKLCTAKLTVLEVIYYLTELFTTFPNSFVRFSYFRWASEQNQSHLGHQCKQAFYCCIYLDNIL